MKREIIRSLKPHEDGDPGRDPVEIALMVVGVVLLAAIVVLNAAWVTQEDCTAEHMAADHPALVADASSGEPVRIEEWDWVFWTPPVESVAAVIDDPNDAHDMREGETCTQQRLTAYAALLLRSVTG